MTDTDAVPFLRGLTAVAEIFERELSDAAQMLYFDTLKDLPLDACLRALEAAAKSNTFMPRPAEIRQIVTGDGTDPELAIERAWLTYKQLAATVGGYQSVTITDPALADALLAIFGSWEEACWTDLTPEMWTAKRKEFGRVYRVCQTRGETAPKVLTGFCARRNLERYGVVDPLHLDGPTPALIEGAPIDADAIRATQRANVERAIAAFHDTKADTVQ